MVFKSILYKTCVYLVVTFFNVSTVIIDLINNLILTERSFARTTALRILILASFVSMSQVASAQLVKIRAGSQSVFTPNAQPCFNATVERKTRALTKVEAECIFENGEIRAEAYATSGPGVLAVDVSAEVKIVVSHFQVDTVAGATATSYIPIQITIPVSWKGRFFNMTGLPAATASVNMYLRLRETDAADPNVAGALVSQIRFQGASHGGIARCLSIPTDTVSVATMLVGCALAVTEKDEGRTLTLLSGVIRTNQPYSIELVARADLTSPFFTNPIDSYVPEKINFRKGFGLTWKENAVVRIGTDAERTVSGIREEVAMLAEELALLRRDFEGHYHTYLTGRGNGHNNVITETPPPLLSEPLPEAQFLSNNASGNLDTQTFTDPTTANQTPASEDELLDTGANGGSLGIPAIMILALLAIRRRSEE